MNRKYLVLRTINHIFSCCCYCCWRMYGWKKINVCDKRVCAWFLEVKKPRETTLKHLSLGHPSIHPFNVDRLPFIIQDDIVNSNYIFCPMVFIIMVRHHHHHHHDHLNHVPRAVDIYRCDINPNKQVVFGLGWWWWLLFQKK